jgi:hypothetical protein
MRSNVADVEGAWPVIGGLPLAAAIRCALDIRVVLLGAPTSLAGIMVIDPCHAAATYVRGAPKRARQREHMALGC